MKPKFKINDIVANNKQKTIGIVRIADDMHGEAKTDADGNCDVDVLEIYDENKHTGYSIAPSTKKEIKQLSEHKTKRTMKTLKSIIKNSEVSHTNKLSEGEIENLAGEIEVKLYPNSFEDWHETHFEIVKHITLNEDYVLDQFCEDEGTGGLYLLAERLTTEFELLHKGKEWGKDDDTQYFDHLEIFLKEKL